MILYHYSIPIFGTSICQCILPDFCIAIGYFINVSFHVLWLCGETFKVTMLLNISGDIPLFVFIHKVTTYVFVYLINVHNLLLFKQWLSVISESHLTNYTRFNKILTRFAIQAKGPDGKWTRKPLAYRESNNVHLLIARPPEICVNLVFKHIHAASSYTIC